MNESKTVALKLEMNFIYSADSHYWRQGTQSNREARAEHQHRQDRLQEIRSKLICSASTSVPAFHKPWTATLAKPM
jgi:hypothetical protein